MDVQKSKPNSKPKPKKTTRTAGGGRKSRYIPSVHNYQAYSLLLAGHSLEQVAEALNIAPKTLREWRRKYDDFGSSITEGLIASDEMVEAALFKRAVGIKAIVRKPMVVSGGTGEGSHIEYADNEIHYPPDTSAAKYWLSKRKAERWGDTSERVEPSLRKIVDKEGNERGIDWGAYSDEDLLSFIGDTKKG